jgi:outer membrane protein assembly factor BamE
MYKSLMIFLMALTLCGCSYFHVHKPEIEQGNVITQDNVQRLHTGMSEEQVKNIMGPPMLTNAFTLHRVEYVYTYQLGNNTRTEKRVSCVFVNGRLSQINQS